MALHEALANRIRNQHSMTITFFIHGDPKPQPRPRAFARRMGAKFVARVYDAGTAEGWKSQIAMTEAVEEEKNQ